MKWKNAQNCKLKIHQIQKANHYVKRCSTSLVIIKYFKSLRFFNIPKLTKNLTKLSIHWEFREPILLVPH